MDTFKEETPRTRGTNTDFRPTNSLLLASAVLSRNAKTLVYSSVYNLLPTHIRDLCFRLGDTSVCIGCLKHRHVRKWSLRASNPTGHFGYRKVNPNNRGEGMGRSSLVRATIHYYRNYSIKHVRLRVNSLEMKTWESMIDASWIPWAQLCSL